MADQLHPALFVILLINLNGLVLSQTPCLDESSRPITTCDRCLWRPDCVWCPDIQVSSLAVGCIKKDSGFRCSKPEEQPKHSTKRIKNNLWTTSQISPQEVEVIQSPNQEAKVNFTVKLANVPVDIYFVMDLSNSMGNHRENLIETTVQLSEQVRLLTEDYQLGFGSFSDKPTPPFSSETSYYLNDKNRNQPPPYSFHHQLSMTKDVNRFKSGVSSSRLAANVDSPESGLDALMQVITCENNVIGWRDGVRKVIIFITDEESHYAYDGILGGLVKPQDAQCSTSRDPRTRNVWYTKELEFDYPSFGQIRDQLKDKNMAVIFAVDAKKDVIYRELSLFIQDTENIGHLKKDTTSLQEIVVQQYQAIKSRIVIQTSTASAELMDISFSSNCQNPSNNHRTCSNVTESERVKYEATIVLKGKACQQKGATHKLTIGLGGFVRNNLLVKIKCGMCECDTRPEPNSAVCEGDGTLTCGGCECKEGYSGRRCECKPSDLNNANSAFGEEKCRPPGGGTICLGRGKCCGTCTCDKPFLG